MERERLPASPDAVAALAAERAAQAIQALDSGAPKGEAAREALAAWGFAGRLKEPPDGLAKLEQLLRAKAAKVCLAAADTILVGSISVATGFVQLDREADEVDGDEALAAYRPLAEKLLARVDDDELAWWGIRQLGWRGPSDYNQLLQDIAESGREQAIEEASLFVSLMAQAETLLAACAESGLPGGLGETLGKFEAIAAEKWHVERGHEAFAMTAGQKEAMKEAMQREPVVLPFSPRQAPALAAAEGAPEGLKGGAFTAKFRALDGRWRASLSVPPGAEDDTAVFVEFRTADGSMVEDAAADCAGLRAPIEDGAAEFRLGDLRQAWAKPAGPVLAVDYDKDVSPGVRTDRRM